MTEYAFLAAFSDGFSLWVALNAIAPFAILMGFGVAVVLTLILIRAIKKLG